MANRLFALPMKANYITTSTLPVHGNSYQYGNGITRNHSMVFTTTEENLFNVETTGDKPDENIHFTTGFFDDEKISTTTEYVDPLEPIALSANHDSCFPSSGMHISVHDDTIIDILQEPQQVSDPVPVTCINTIKLSNSFSSYNQTWPAQVQESASFCSNSHYKNKARCQNPITYNQSPHMVLDDDEIFTIKRELDQVSKYAKFLQGLMSPDANKRKNNVVESISSSDNTDNTTTTKTDALSMVCYPQELPHQVMPKFISNHNNNKSHNMTLTKKPSSVVRASTDIMESNEDNVRGLPPPPLRALSAYNFFFHDERERLLNEVEEMDLSEAKADALLLHHWNRDRSQKRIHRKTHGKFPFAELSKMISKRWKKLDASEREFYEKISAKDWDRYQREMEERKRIEKIIKKSQREAIRKMKHKVKTTGRKTSKAIKKSLQPSCSVVSL